MRLYLCEIRVKTTKHQADSHSGPLNKHGGHSMSGISSDIIECYEQNSDSFQLLDATKTCFFVAFSDKIPLE